MSRSDGYSWMDKHCAARVAGHGRHAMVHVGGCAIEVNPSQARQIINVLEPVARGGQVPEDGEYWIVEYLSEEVIAQYSPRERDGEWLLMGDPIAVRADPIRRLDVRK